MTNMMEAVLNSGLAYGVREQGFTAPAAGKTGSSHDAWFAGYTSNLLCIVWVGFDDYTDLKITGARAAAPIWGDFMKRAIQLPRYSNPRPFNAPDGVVVVQLDKNTNRLATAACPDTYTAAFIAGTEPKETCDQATGVGGVLSKIGNFFGLKPAPPPTQQPAQPVINPAQRMASTAVNTPPAQAQPQQQQPGDKKKKGFFSRIFGAMKDDEPAPQNPQSQSPPPTAQPH
jgi:penicillin-binding protein 1B